MVQSDEVAFGPWRIVLLLGGDCDSHCPFCLRQGKSLEGRQSYAWHGTRNPLPLSRVKDMLDHFRPTLTCLVLSSLGEPLLYPWMHELLGLIRNEYTQLNTVNITTNASRLGDYPELLALPGFLSLSFDAANPAIYHTMRPGLDYRQVLANLQEAGRAARHPNRRVGVNMAVFERNVHEVYPVASLIARAGLSYLSVVRGYATGTKFDREIVAEDDMRVLEQARRIERDFPGLEVFSFTFSLADKRVPDKAAKEGHCTFPWYTLDITPDEHAHPCCNAYGIDLGHWREAWVGEALRRLRAQMVEGKLDPLEFSDCYYCLWHGDPACS